MKVQGTKENRKAQRHKGTKAQRRGGAAGFLAGFVFMAVFSRNVFAWDDPKATFTFGSSTNTNIFNKPDEISDKINDTSLKVSFPHELKKKQTKLNIDLNFKQDWKQEQEKINSRSKSVKFGLNHTYSKKLSLAGAYTYSDFDSFLSSAINLTISPKFSKTNSAKIDYTYTGKTFPNKKLNATNQVAKLDYKIQLTKKTSLTPFVGYEVNSVPGSLGSEYKGTTAGLRYEWKMSKKTTLTTSYDMRARDYDNPTKASLNVKGKTTDEKTALGTLGWYGSKRANGTIRKTCSQMTTSCYYDNVTRVEKRGQLSFGIKYAYQKNTDFNIKYIHYKNNVDSSDQGSKFGATKEYNTDIFSFSVSLKSLKAKKPKKAEDETKKGGEE